MRSVFSRYGFKLCHWISSFGVPPRRFFSSKTTDDSTDMEKVQNYDEAERWLESLSPEMESTKQIIERKVQFLKNREELNDDIELKPEDFKNILMDGLSLSAVKRYLRNKRLVTKMDTQNRVNSIWKELEDQDKNFASTDPDTYKVSNYVSTCPDQGERHIKHCEARAAINSALPVVFDMDYSVTIGNQYKAIRHIDKANKSNRRFSEPCSIHVTSAFKGSVIADRLEKGLYDNGFLNFHEKGFEDLFPRQYLVYLCPLAPPLLTHIPGDIYVISGFSGMSQLCLEKARQLKIRCGSIPFTRFGIKENQLKNKSGYILTPDNVFDLVLKINLKQEWEYVMKEILMKNKIHTELQRAEYKDFLNGYHTIPPFDDPEKEAFRKHRRKRRKC